LELDGLVQLHGIAQAMRSETNLVRLKSTNLFPFLKGMDIQSLIRRNIWTVYKVVFVLKFLYGTMKPG
jgi:hypothetical protein